MCGLRADLSFLTTNTVFAVGLAIYIAYMLRFVAEAGNIDIIAKAELLVCLKKLELPTIFTGHLSLKCFRFF